jgi:hypothetical protein
LSKAAAPFWLDGGYDFDCVQACRHHPTHHWITLRLGDVLENPGNPSETIVICAACFVPRCVNVRGRDKERCTMWRHHATDHLYLDGKTEPIGGIGLPERMRR